MLIVKILKKVDRFYMDNLVFSYSQASGSSDYYCFQVPLLKA